MFILPNIYFTNLYSTICRTPVQAILDQKNLTGLAGGVKERQNMAQNGPRFYISLASEPSRGP